MLPILALSSVLLASAVQTPQRDYPEFGQAELEALVAELAPVVPENPAYRYPIEIQMVESDVVNAHAGFDPRDGGVLQATMVMERGLVDWVHGDRRILRACIAHELAHLACGHSLVQVPDSDVGNGHTRQAEWEADEVGSQYLEKIGASREDMVDLLQALDAFGKAAHCPWIFSVAGDHGSPLLRAARITHGEALLKAVSRFEIGLMYMECRRFESALAFFDQALALEPELHEAELDAASAALQDYYDHLPARVQDEWLRPEFGPALSDTLLMQGRAIQITDEDRQRYGHVLARLAAAPADFNPAMHRFLFATARVLHPEGDEAALKQGVGELENLLADMPTTGLWDAHGLRLRVANNLALGLARLGQTKKALLVLVRENATDPAFVLSAAENLARLPLRGALDDEQAKLVASTLRMFLDATPADAPGAKEAQRAFDSLLKEHSLQFTGQEAPRANIALCSAVSLTVDGKEIGLFQEFGEVTQVFGKLPYGELVDEKYPELRYLFWGEDPRTAEIFALAEGNELVKLTSYRPGTVLELRPRRETGLQTVYRVRVGMSEAELDALLAPAGGSAGLKAQTFSLQDRQNFLTEPPEGGFLPWRYYAELEFGVMLENGVVSAIAVTPVEG